MGLNMNQLAVKLAVNEGLKKNVAIGDIKEILKFIAIIISEDTETLTNVLKYGAKAAKDLGKPKTARAKKVKSV